MEVCEQHPEEPAARLALAAILEMESVFRDFYILTEYFISSFCRKRVFACSGIRAGRGESLGLCFISESLDSAKNPRHRGASRGGWSQFSGPKRTLNRKKG